jgi:RecG-like helicase
VANEVGQGKVFDQDDNQVILIRRAPNNRQDIITETWPEQNKTQIARRLGEAISNFFKAA